LVVDFPVQIGFDDFLLFSGFSEFPSFRHGQLKLKVRLTASALVFCCVPPEVTVPEYLELGTEADEEDEAVMTEVLTEKTTTPGSQSSSYMELQQAAKQITPYDRTCYYDKKFTQARTKARVCTQLFQVDNNAGTYYSYAGKDITVEVYSMKAVRGWSYIAGYNLREDVLKQFNSHYDKIPMVIAAEHLTNVSFQHAIHGDKLHSTAVVNLRNLKEFCVVFYKQAHECTCADNPCLSHLQLASDNTKYPIEPLITNTLNFLRHQTEVNALDTILCPTPSYIRSYICPPATKKGVRGRAIGDNTQFVWTIPLERLSANSFYPDPVNWMNASLAIDGQAIISKDHRNTFAELQRNDEAPEQGKVNNMPPTGFGVHDSLWIFTPDGQCLYITDRTYHEVFSQPPFLESYSAVQQQTPKGLSLA
jgi:hypothetical protein